MPDRGMRPAPLERRHRIILLLQHRDQHLPDISRGRQADSGFVHNTLAPTVCPTCDGVDEHCATCHGRGHIEVKRDLDPYAENKIVRYGANGAQHDAAHARDATIDRLQQQLAPPRSEADLIAEANAHPFGWEAARQRMYARFDYQALDHALEALRLVDDDAYRLIHRTFVYALLDVPADSRAARLIESGLGFIDGLMPDPIRAPDPVVPVVNLVAKGRPADRRALTQRDGEVRRLVLEEGVSSRVAAARLGLSVSQVNRIVKGEVA